MSTRGLETLRDDLLGRRGAVHVGHRQIHHDHVGLEALGHHDRFATGLRFTDDLDVLRDTEHRLEPGANDGVVVGEHYADHVSIM